MPNALMVDTLFMLLPFGMSQSNALTCYQFSYNYEPCGPIMSRDILVTPFRYFIEYFWNMVNVNSFISNEW